MADENTAPETDSQEIVLENLTPEEVERVEIKQKEDGTSEYVLKAEDKSESTDSPEADSGKDKDEAAAAASKETPATDIDDSDKEDSELFELPPEAFVKKMKELKSSASEGKPEDYDKAMAELSDNPLHKSLWDSENRVAGLQKGFQSERQQRRNLEKDRSQSKKKAAQDSVQGFTELSEEDVAEIKEDDPDKYIEYQLQLKDIEAKRKANEEQEISSAEQEQVGEFSDFLFDTLGFEIKSGTTEADIAKVLPVDTRNKVDEKLAELFGIDKVYTAAQIATVYNSVTMGQKLIDARVAARESVAESVENAEKSTDKSRLDSASNSKTIVKVKKGLDDLSIEEMQSMGEDEFQSNFNET